VCQKPKVLLEIPRRTYQRIKEPYERQLQPGKETETERTTSSMIETAD
jgi:hypothetical protein